MFRTPSLTLTTCLLVLTLLAASFVLNPVMAQDATPAPAAGGAAPAAGGDAGAGTATGGVPQVTSAT